MMDQAVTSIKDIIRSVAKQRNMSATDILSKHSKKGHVHARQAVMSLANQAGCSHREIAEALGLDVATIRYGLQAHDRRGQGSAQVRVPIAVLADGSPSSAQRARAYAAAEAVVARDFAEGMRPHFLRVERGILTHDAVFSVRPKVG